MLNEILKKNKGGPISHIELLGRAKEMGRRLGKLGLPAEGENSIEPYMRPITAGYMELYAPYARKGAKGERASTLRKKATTERKQQLEHKAKQLEARKRREETELGELPEAKNSGGTLMNAAVCFCICVCEGAIATKVIGAFERGSNLQQMGIFAFLSFIFYGCSKVFVAGYRSAEGYRHPYVVKAVMFAFVGVVFGSLAYARSLFMGNASLTSIEATPGEGVHLHWTFWMAIQLFMFAISVGMTFMMPSDDDRSLAKQRGKAEKAFAETEEELRRCEKELSRLPLEEIEDEISQDESEARFETERAKIQAQYQQACAAFKDELAVYREGSLPACVHVPVPPLNIDNI